MTTEPIEGEVVDERALVQRGDGYAVVDVEHSMREWEAYQDLTRRLLTDDDYPKIGNRKFKKKSAWRKYARAFNISCERVAEEIVRDDDGWPRFARIVVRASDPSGRYQDAEQECHVTERCCEKARGETCSNRSQYHQHCPLACNGKTHFSHPGDIAATAFTRAKNRAISDLIGAGEVSAEEMPAQPQAPAARRPAAAQAVPVADGAGISDRQAAAIHTMLTKCFGTNERAAFDWMAAMQPKACEGTQVHVKTLTGDEASAVIDALNDELTAKK